MADKKTTKKVPGLRVTAKRDGFRRGGQLWSGTTEVPLSDLDKEQIEQLKAEPMLRVEETEIEVEG